MVIVESKHPSQTFRVVRSNRSRPHHNPPKVLVAEDDDAMRALIVDALWRDGYDVRSVGDGGDLIAEMAEQVSFPESGFDLVISDLRMPIAGGLQILQALRRADCNVAMIVMTAFGDDETRVTAERLGALFFDKPFSLDDLRTAVMNLVPIR